MRHPASAAHELISILPSRTYLLQEERPKHFASIMHSLQRLAVGLILWLCLTGILRVVSLLLQDLPLAPLSAHDLGTSADSDATGGIRAFFSFPTPSVLFPSSAIIGLTDDNSTFFLARPAAFGPDLPGKGLSGQLWVGSTFDDEDAGREAGLGAGAVGELGCGDQDDLAAERSWALVKDASDVVGAYGLPRLKEGAEGDRDRRATSGLPTDGSNDNTGDEDSRVSRSFGNPSVAEHNAPSIPREPTQHADIQSLQESAEIAGKIVLLRRGGCSFLAKVKWVQRRGGRALIVGDHTKGGGLVTMYAREDTSNVSIPSLFTSYTTAHLLSTLVPSDLASSKANDPTLGAGAPDAHVKSERLESASVRRLRCANRRGGWVSKIFAAMGFRRTRSSVSQLEPDSRRPPSSGRLDWIPAKDGPKDDATATTTASPEDGFIIGVHDWRDPDLVRSDFSGSDSGSKQRVPASSSDGVAPKADKFERDGELPSSGVLQGGFITPGSGEYSNLRVKRDSQPPHDRDVNGGHASPTDELSGKGWLRHVSRVGDGPGDESHGDDRRTSKTRTEGMERRPTTDEIEFGNSMPELHEGLWVTLTPTNMSTSPFFDTLLVVLVSPLLTLTMVYGLLVVRDRIRRRQWRAPKSVVDKLPVRTYHAAPSLEPSTEPSAPSNSPASPLLSSEPINTSLQPSPHLAAGSDLLSQVPTVARSWPPAAHEAPIVPKIDAASPRARRYTGRQDECVICLEAYVDGVSQVMRLPCGHEFHVECITPWLTTRRRTCPICKGDVVRSFESGSCDSEDLEVDHPEEEDTDTDPDTASPTRFSVTLAGAPHSNTSADVDVDLEGAPHGSSSMTPPGSGRVVTTATIRVTIST